MNGKAGRVFLEASVRSPAECERLRELLHRAGRGIIVRCMGRRLEIVAVSKSAGQVASMLSTLGVEARPYTPRVGDPRSLIGSGEYYAAHVSSEKLIPDGRHEGLCLARYTALLAKLSEMAGRPALDHILGLLEEEDCWDVLDRDCVYRLARENVGSVGGREALACLREPPTRPRRAGENT